MASAVPRRFEPKGVVGWLVLFGACYVFAFGFATTMVYRDLGASESEVFPARAQQALLVLLYLLAGYAILLYGVFGAHRFRFSDAGCEVFTWRGRRAFSWHDVRRAQLSSFKGSLELALVFGARRLVSVPLTSFRQGASLLDFIRSRVSVPITATAVQLAMIADD